MVTRLLTAAALVALTSGCDYELQELPAVPPPEIKAAQLKCEVVANEFVISSFSVTVENAEGVAHLEEPYIQVGTMHFGPDVLTLTEGETSAAHPVDTPIEQTWSWERTNENRDAYSMDCGEDGRGLVLRFEIQNEQGWPTPRLVIQSEPVN